MGLLMTASGVTELTEGVWELEMPPHQMRMFGNAAASKGRKSVLLVANASFDPHSHELRFDADQAFPLNVGTGSSAVAIASDVAAATEPVRGGAQVEGAGGYGPGDREFLVMARKHLPPPMQRAALALLNGVRARSAGDLKKGKARNFSDTPDNFWYVIVQPRVEQLSITVRGTVDHFQPVARLPIKDDRGNTLFKVSGEEDVPAALELILHAKRKS